MMVAASLVTKIFSRWLMTIFFMPTKFTVSLGLFKQNTVWTKGGLGHVGNPLAGFDVLENRFLETGESLVALGKKVKGGEEEGGTSLSRFWKPVDVFSIMISFDFFDFVLWV